MARQLGEVGSLIVHEADEAHNDLTGIRDHAQLQHGLGVEDFKRPAGAPVFFFFDGGRSVTMPIAVGRNTSKWLITHPNGRAVELDRCAA